MKITTWALEADCLHPDLAYELGYAEHVHVAGIDLAGPRTTCRDEYYRLGYLRVGRIVIPYAKQKSPFIYTCRAAWWLSEKSVKRVLVYLRGRGWECEGMVLEGKGYELLGRYWEELERRFPTPEPQPAPALKPDLTLSEIFPLFAGQSVEIQN